MSEPTENFEDDVRQKLVAYLDGELDEESAREVENELSHNSTVRQEMDTLKKAWELLDYLPRPQAPQSFTHRTVERLSAVKLKTLRRERQVKWLGRLAWAAGITFVGLLSGWTVYRMIPSSAPSAEELREVFEYRGSWQYFQDVGSVELLKSLDHPDLFGEDS